MRLPPFWRPSKRTIQCRKTPDPAREILWDAINQFARRHLGSPQVARGAVRCPIAFELARCFGESDTLKRSDTTAVTLLLTLFPHAGHQSTPNNRGLPGIVIIARSLFPADGAAYERGKTKKSVGC